MYAHTQENGVSSTRIDRMNRSNDQKRKKFLMELIESENESEPNGIKSD